MRPDDRDMARLWDMLDAARAAVEFIQGMDFEAFLRDRKTRHAVERSLEILGEAARRVSSGTREALTDIPWISIIGLRNVLAHEYGEIRYERLWEICENELPLLIRRLVAAGADALPPEQEK